MFTFLKSRELHNVLEGDGGESTTAAPEQQSQEQSQPQSSTVLDENAAPATQGVYTVEQFITQFGEEGGEGVEAFARKFSDDNGNIKVDMLAKSGFHLEKKFGGFTGAPDEYSIKTPEFLEGDVDASDPYVAEFMEAAKGANMNQETFEKLMDIHLRASVAPPVDMEVLKKEIGPDFDAMRSNMAGFYKQHLEDAEFKQLSSMINSPDAFRTIYKIFQASRPTQIEDKVRENFNQNELKSQMEAEYLATDDYGNPKMQDPSYAEQWRSRWEQFMGG